MKLNQKAAGTREDAAAQEGMAPGARILIEALIAQGVEVIFGYPGGSVLNIYDALYEAKDRIEHVTASHEQGAAHAADGYARSTGKTGVVLATSGPGATNLVTGLATAYHDSVPVVAITGNVTRDLIGRDSFQEVDIVGITQPVVKHNFQVREAAALADTVRRAFEIANSGRKGPVLIDIPKDVTAEWAALEPIARYAPRPLPSPDEADLDHAAMRIEKSRRPLVYFGGGVTFTDAAPALAAFLDRCDMPACASMMGLSSMPYNAHRFLGMVGMHGTATANKAVSTCDLLIAVGARFSDRVAGNRTAFAQDARVLHIDIDKAEISKNVLADEWLIGDAGDILARLTQRLPRMSHAAWMKTLAHHKARNALPHHAGEGESVNPREVIRCLSAVAGPDAIVATDVGQHQMLVAQYYRFVRPRSLLSSCGLGTMGYGMGAANGAAMGNPGRAIALVTGDGSFHMNLAELAVAVSLRLPIVVLVMNNRVLGMVHQWQSLFYGKRYSCTELDRSTDFVKLAEAFGAKGLRIVRRSEIQAAMEEAFACGGPCVVDVVIDAQDGVFPIIPPGGSEGDAIFAEDYEDYTKGMR